MARTPSAAWRTIAETEFRHRGVTEGTGFGRTEGLRIDGKIFAMFMNDRLVVKLPRERVDELVGSKIGERFSTGHGRVMKEWVAVGSAAMRMWASLAADAREFVATRSASRSGRPRGASP